MRTETETGFTADFEGYVVAKAAELVAAGATADAAIREAMSWAINLYIELADGKTTRARAFHREATERTYGAIRQ